MKIPKMLKATVKKREATAGEKARRTARWSRPPRCPGGRSAGSSTCTAEASRNTPFYESYTSSIENQSKRITSVLTGADASKDVLSKLIFQSYGHVRSPRKRKK